MTDRYRHLLKRTVESFGRQAPAPDLEQWARKHLSDDERQLWDRLHPRDRRHAIGVAKRFIELEPEAPIAAIAGALLHDIGKADAPSSLLARIAAELLGPVTPGLRRLRDHETIGREMLERAESDPVTIAAAGGTGRWGPSVTRADDL